MKNKYQITYKDAVKICNAYDNFNFHATEVELDGYKVVTFNYFLCEYAFFVQPLKDEPHIHARDMRGVTFVFNKDGTLYKRFLMLEKFFNINQVEETQYDLVKDKKIASITYKEDGSLIAFMQLPNGKVFGKTQGGFDNEQSIRANEIYENDTRISSYVNNTLKRDFTPLFEYVAYDNRIVLKYPGRNLRLIGTRDNKYGEYFPASRFLISIDNFKIAEAYEYNTSIDELIERAKTAQDIEGWVIQFEDDQMIKIKTEWYFNLHGIRTVSIFREDFIIKNYLEETLDDATQELNMKDDADAFAFIDKVKKATMNWSKYIEQCVNELYDLYNDSNGYYYKNWTKFATDKHKSPFFGLTRKKIERPDEYIKYKTAYMINASKHLMQARKLVEKWQ